MGTRLERVVIEVVDKASTPMATLAARTALTARELDGLDSSGNRAAKSMDNVGESTGRTGTALRRSGTDLDSYTKRLSLLGTAVATLGPAAVPITASLLPAVTGLATGMAGAAGAAAAAGLAFAGVGDALGALNDFQLEPSAENFVKLQQAMDELGPAGENFVRYLDSIGGEIENLQQIAGTNMFPGMTAGLQSLMTLMPRVQVLIGDLAARMGDLSADAGAALAGPQWEAFFSFLEADAAPIFEQFARAAGNVALGLGNLMVAFAPLSRDFASGMLEASRAFASWSADTSNFEGFIEYVRQIGPQVSDFLGSLAKAAVALAEAVAPWGSVVLPAMTAVLDIFTAIAGSPIGPALATAALAMLAFNKAAAAGSLIMGRVAPAVGGVRSSLGQVGADLKTVSGGWVLASSATEREAKKMTAATERLKSSMASVGKGAGVLGAVGVAASGAASGIGLQNTAMLGLAGTIAGPWGAAAGAGVGLILDMKAAQDQAVAASKEFADTLDRQTGALTANSESWVQNQLSADQAQALVDAGLDLDMVTKKVAEGSDAWIAYRESAGLSGSDKGSLFRSEAEDAATALDKLSGQADDGHQSWNLWSDATNDASASASAAVSAFNELTAAQQAQAQASLAAIDAGTAYGAALDKAAKQAESAEQGFNKFTEAGRNNRTAMSQLVAAYNAQDAATKNSVKGYQDARREIAELGRGMGLTGARIRELQGYLDKPSILRVDSQEAQAAIRGARSAFESLPKEVRTTLGTRGIPKTNAEINALVKKYGLTEKQRTALVTLKDLASSGIGNIISLINSIPPSRQSTIRVDYITTHTVITNQARGVRANLAYDADGGFHQDGVRAFADGGYGMDGRYYSRQPMLIPGGANILWGEKETGWEAYISGKPGERERNLEILAMAADRLGATVIPAAMGRITAYANGGTAKGFGKAVHSPQGWANIAKSLDRLSDRLERHGKRLERSLGRAEKAVDRAKDTVSKWNDRRDELKSAVRSSLTRDWMGDGNQDVWSAGAQEGTAAFAREQWSAQAKDAKQLTALIANLRKNGAGDAFIAEILRSDDPLAAAKAFNSESKKSLLHTQKLFTDATRYTNAAATSTSSIYADEQRKANAQLAAANKRLDSLEKAINRNHKEAEATRKRESAAKSAAKGARSRKR